MTPSGIEPATFRLVAQCKLIFLLPLALQPAVCFGLSNNTSPFFPIYHQLSPSSHSQNLKISFYFFSLSFPGSSSSSRPFQFLSEDLFGHPILLHSLQVTQPTYPLPLYPFYYIFSFTQFFYFWIRPTFPFPIFVFRTIYSSKYFPFKNKQRLFLLLRHRPCFRSICYYRSY